MSGVEIVSVNEVASSLINICNNVDLVSGINVIYVISFSFVDEPDKSSFLVESSIGTDNII